MAKNLNSEDLTHDIQGKIISVKNANTLDWSELAKTQQLSESFILANADFFDWNIISENQEITPKIMLTFPKKIKWDKIAKNTQISTNGQLVAKYKGDQYKLLTKEQLSEDFLRENYEILDLQQICSYQMSLSEVFITDFEDKINLKWIAQNKLLVLSEAFINDFKYILNTQDIIKNQKKNLSTVFLKEYKKFDLRKFYQNTTEEWLNNYPHQNRLDWDLIATETKNLSENFLENNWDKLNPNAIITRHKISEDFVRRIAHKITKESNLWAYFFNTQSFSQSFLEENLDKITFENISYGDIIENISLDFIIKHENEWNWRGIGQVRRFDQDFLRKYVDRWDWDWNIAYCQRVSMAFLDEFSDKFSSYGWTNLSQKQKLTEDFIRKYHNKVSWADICENQVLSESFMKEFSQEMYWEYVQYYQEYSEEFAKNFGSKQLNPAEAMLKLNQKAWTICTEEPNKTQLEIGLNLVAKSLQCKAQTQTKIMPNYVEDTQVRLLIKLNRTDEAYSIVKWALEKNTDFVDFQEFKTNENYLNWLKNN